MMAVRDVWHAALQAALATACLLLVPLAAMRFTDAVHWTPLDFAVAGVLLFGAGFAFALVMRTTPRMTLRLAFGIALAGGLALAWVNLAVGLLGQPGNPANLVYAGVLSVGVVGAVLARLEPRGMALAMLATALAMTVAAVLALAAGHGVRSTPVRAIVIVHGLFVGLFLASAWLFRRAARHAGTKPPRVP